MTTNLTLDLRSEIKQLREALDAGDRYISSLIWASERAYQEAYIQTAFQNKIQGADGVMKASRKALDK